MAREDGNWLQDYTTGDNLKINSDGSLNVKSPELVYNEAGKLFSAIFEWANVSTAEKNLILLRNPSGSGKNIVLLRIVTVCYDTVASSVHFHTYSSPTVTATGTALTILSGRIKSSPPTSSMLAYRDPTTSSLGGLRASTRAVGGPSGTSQAEYCYRGGIIIEPSNDFLVTGTADGTNRDVTVFLEWAEV